jgi:DNA-directed RNA polymerase specialized sigma24 family protein
LTAVSSRKSLERIETLTACIARAETDRRAAVAAALADGATWAEIAAALGVSAQAAHKRFRWLRASADGTEVWHEPPLPL